MSINLAKNEQQLADEVLGKINLSKDKVNLSKKVVNLSKCIVDLSKKEQVDIGATKAQVVFVFDASYSMNREYSDGTVQDTITTLLPLGLTFDDNGTCEVYKFSSHCKKCDDLNIENYENYVRTSMGSPDGTTKYSGPLKQILEDYFGLNMDGAAVSYSKPKKQGFFSKLLGKNKAEEEEVAAPSVTSGGSMADTSEFPVFVLYITDGDIDAGDEDRMNQLVRESSKHNCFLQFIGVSKTASFKFLRALDDLDGRECDNTGFTKFDDLRDISDTEMYNAVLGQYAKWLKVRGF